MLLSWRSVVRACFAATKSCLRILRSLSLTPAYSSGHVADVAHAALLVLVLPDAALGDVLVVEELDDVGRKEAPSGGGCC